MARKKREYTPEFIAFWDAWSGRNKGADKIRAGDIWDAAQFTQGQADTIIQKAKSAPPEAVPMAWLRERAAQMDTIPDTEQTQDQSTPEVTDIQISKNSEPTVEPETHQTKTDISDIQIFENNDTGNQAKRRRGRPKNAVPTVAVMMHIRPDTRAWLKMKSFETGKTMSEIIDTLVSKASEGDTTK